MATTDAADTMSVVTEKIIQGVSTAFQHASTSCLVSDSTQTLRTDSRVDEKSEIPDQTVPEDADTTREILYSGSEELLKTENQRISKSQSINKGSVENAFTCRQGCSPIQGSLKQSWNTCVQLAAQPQEESQAPEQPSTLLQTTSMFTEITRPQDTMCGMFYKTSYSLYFILTIITRKVKGRMKLLHCKQFH